MTARIGSRYIRWMSDRPRYHYGLLHRFRHRHRILLAVLVAFVVALPAIDEGVIAPGLASLGLTLVVVPAVLATGRNARRIVIGIALASPCVVIAVLSLIAGEEGHTGLHAIHLISMIAFLAFTVFEMTRHLFRTSYVNEEILASAVGVYMLAAFLFAALYQLLALHEETPIQGIESVDRISDFVYFSFTTQTTVGFGDMVPKTPAAKTLTILQSVSGPLFLVVLLARLVGLHLTHRPPRGGNE